MSSIKQHISVLRIVVALVFITVLLMPQLVSNRFILHTLFMILIWSICGVGWNVLSGSTGQMSLGHSLYFGVGAYVSTMLFMELRITPWVGIFAAAIVAGVLAFIFSRFMFKLSGFYFAIGTIALSEITFTLFMAWRYVGSARGLLIPIYRGDFKFLVAMQSNNAAPYIYTALGVLVICLIGSNYLSRSRAGYYFRAIRDEAEAAESFGIDLRKYKTIAYMYSAVFCAMAGVLYAHYAYYIDPDSVMHNRIAVQIAIVAILGGIGNLWGPIIGATVLVAVSEFARLNLGGTGQAVDLLIYAMFIIIFAVFQPHGIIGMINSIIQKFKSIKKAEPAKAVQEGED